MTSSDGLKRGPETEKCPTCGETAVRVGAQDELDNYLCPNKHVTRLPIKRWAS